MATARVEAGKVVKAHPIRHPNACLMLPVPGIDNRPWTTGPWRSTWPLFLAKFFYAVL